MALLNIEELTTTFHISVGDVQAVRGISLAVEAGESIGIVGESGSGKSVSMLSVMGLLPPNCEVTARSICFDGRELTGLRRSELRRLLGADISMIFQDPMTSLNPLYTIGNQITESIRIHLKLPRQAARERALEMLRMVEIPSPESRLKQYPHEFSGGMRQRAMIAMAVACNPKLIIADEPTTALDVTIQAQILDLLKGLKEKLNTSIIMITHDLGVITNMCTRIFVMYGGQVVEAGATREIFYQPRHPYTWGLLGSLPRVRGEGRKKLVPIPGSPPDMLAPPPGCSFAARCPYAMRVCKQVMPPVSALSGTHQIRCHLMHPSAPKVEPPVGGRGGAR